MTLAHEVTGSGPTVVLLHSTVCDRRMWDPQVGPPVTAGYRVLRCDLRGFGDTPLVRSYSNAEDVRDLLDELAIESAVLVGASMGGRIAQEIAVRWPDRVTGLVLLCSAMRGADRTADVIEFVRREDELLEAGDIAAAVELNLDTWLGPEADQPTRARVREMQRRAFEVQLAFGDVQPRETTIDVSAIRAPTLIVSGAHDDFHRHIADVLAERIQGAIRVHLPWAGHLPSVERPAEINALLLDFLASR